MLVLAIYVHGAPNMLSVLRGFLWLDIVFAMELLRSLDFNSSEGCATEPRKIFTFGSDVIVTNYNIKCQVRKM